MRMVRPNALSRRRLLARSAALGSGLIATGLVACKGTRNTSTSQGNAGGKEDSTPRRGGTVAVEWSLTTSQWDPYRVSTGVMQHYGGIFETLVTTNAKTLVVEPGLIESWEEIEPGLHYVLKVRKNAVWENKPPTNGRALDADDVVYNIRYASGLSDPSKAAQIVRASSYRGLESVSAVDKNTVDMKLSTPNAAILSGMADIRQFTIPREIPDQMPFTDYAKFPSIGPFITKEYRDGEVGRYDRNPNYWNQQLPYADQAVTKWYGDNAAKIAALLSGDINIARILAKQEMDQVQKSGQPVTVYPYQYRSTTKAYVNADRIPDKRIAKALRLGFDWAKANNVVYGKGLWDYSGPLDRALPGATPSDKIAQMPGYNPATKEADRKEGASLLRAAGYPDGDGLSLEIISSSPQGNPQFDVLTYFQADIKQMAPKIRLEIRPVPDGGAFARALAARDFQIACHNLLEAADPRLALENYKSKGSRNYSNYANPQFDQLVDKAFAQSFQEALSTVHEAEKILLDEVPVIMLTGQYEMIGANNKVRGVAARLGPGSGSGYNDKILVRKFVWLEQ
jgi:peptide/nickel transport system substrate-binding protein